MSPPPAEGVPPFCPHESGQGATSRATHAGQPRSPVLPRVSWDIIPNSTQVYYWDQQLWGAQAEAWPTDANTGGPSSKMQAATTQRTPIRSSALAMLSHWDSMSTPTYDLGVSEDVADGPQRLFLSRVRTKTEHASEIWDYHLFVIHILSTEQKLWKALPRQGALSTSGGSFLNCQDQEPGLQKEAFFCS